MVKDDKKIIIKKKGAAPRSKVKVSEKVKVIGKAMKRLSSIVGEEKKKKASPPKKNNQQKLEEKIIDKLYEVSRQKGYVNLYIEGSYFFFMKKIIISISNEINNDGFQPFEKKENKELWVANIITWGTKKADPIFKLLFDKGVPCKKVWGADQVEKIMEEL